MHKRVKITYIIIVFLFFIICGNCEIHAQEKYVLKKYYIILDNSNKELNKKELYKYIIQKPEKNFFRKRFFNFFIKKEKRSIVYYDKYLTEQSVYQLKGYLESKGYFKANVKDSIKIIRNKKINVFYIIHTGIPYFVGSIKYNIYDSTLAKIIFKDTLNCTIKRGKIFDKVQLQKERNRISDYIRQNGYFRFSPSYISFNVKVNDEQRYVDIIIDIKPFIEEKVSGEIIYTEHKKYIISNIYINTDFKIITENLLEKIYYDTLSIGNIHFLYNKSLKINPAILLSNIYISPGELYNSENVDKTYQHLSLLNIFKFINMQFTETGEQAETPVLLNCYINLTRRKVHSIQSEVVGTNSYGDLGVRTNITYQNYNLFRNAEVLNVRFTGAFEALKSNDISDITRTFEIGSEIRLEIPKFLLPIRSYKFIKEYSPSTNINFSINHRDERRYVRTYANSSFGYTWLSNRFLKYSVYPIELNYVQVDEQRSQAYRESNYGTIFDYIFRDNLIASIRGSIEYNNQEPGKLRNFQFLRLNIEEAGNLLYMFYRATNQKKDSTGSFNLFKVPFSHFVRTDIDFRFYNVIDNRNTLVYRFFWGLGYPYGNLKVLPFEKKFFAGGPNSLRAWRAYSIGPGSHQIIDSTEYDKFKNTGDIKLEFNFEYRFKLFWKFEGAMFLDAGNIWDIKKQEERPEGTFIFNKFLKDFAIGTGLGIRVDFSFFLIRLDAGLKLRDPSNINDKWITFNNFFSKNNVVLQFGIGYPF